MNVTQKLESVISVADEGRFGRRLFSDGSSRSTDRAEPTVEPTPRSGRSIDDTDGRTEGPLADQQV